MKFKHFYSTLTVDGFVNIKMIGVEVKVNFVFSLKCLNPINCYFRGKYWSYCYKLIQRFWVTCVYLLVSTQLKLIAHLQMLYSEWLDQDL